MQCRKGSEGRRPGSRDDDEDSFHFRSAAIGIDVARGDPAPEPDRLLAGDIFTNIVGATSTLTLEDAWEAAEAAGLAGDIRDMPMGMHTIISDAGSTFSGGQRQRLLIARALVRKPRIIFFDEATSSLDNRTQETVTRTLELSSATRFVIAHRLSTIRKADKIYVMDRGKIVEEGPFDELARGGGLFSRLIARQQA